MGNFKDKLKGKRQSENITDKRLSAIKGKPERPVSKREGKYGPLDAADIERGEAYLKGWEIANGYRDPPKLGVDAGFNSLKDFKFFKHKEKNNK
ncbi:hypothetical protein SmphiM6_4 [Sinorhizobium phage phiM6]|nr:hypothetical protein SmphiM6_4 [Sinorhizobium phage phiM6]